MRIFIVDDSNELRTRLKELVNEISGVEIVGEAEEADTAIARINKVNPDMVLLDIRLMNGHGIDVLHDIRELDDKMIIIMLTNYAYPHYKKRCEEEGADHFLDKTRDFELVPELIKEYMKRNIKGI